MSASATPECIPGRVDLDGLGQRRTTEPHRLTVRCAHANAEGLQQSCPSVGAGAATDDQNGLTASGAQGRRDQLPRPAAGGRQRGEPTTGQPEQAGHLRELDHGCVASAGARRVDRQPRGSAGQHGHEREARRDGCGERAVTTVGDGDLDDDGLRTDRGYSCGEVRRDLLGGERALELVRCEPHGR